ncbi:MAG: ATP-binding protein [Candidatus Scalindua sp.]|nr:ATP-binding protein [Candidatus Scalindua sp.]
MKELRTKKALIGMEECGADAKNSELATINVQLQQRIDKLEHDEKTLQRSNSEIEKLLNVIPLILIGVSRDDRVTLWNKVAVTTFGIPAVNAIGKKIHECDIPWEWEKVDKSVAMSQRTDKPIQIDCVRYQMSDGDYGFLNVTLTPVSNEMVEITHVLLLGRDITEWKKMENQMVQIQKLEAIGQLAAGIAHEINTPTQYIRDNTSFLEEAFDSICKLLNRFSQLLELSKNQAVCSDLLAEIHSMIKEVDLEYLVEEIPEAIGQSQEGLKRVTEIVKAMKTFSHPGNEEVVPININEAIKSTITVARNEWKYVADMKTDFDPELPMIPCFPGEFNQVILNMIINATHAIEEVSNNEDEGKGLISISTHLNKDWAEIRIGDTGTGIPEKYRSKLFDPFFTTKEVGKGTGQGLAIAHSVIVGKHKGTISFETETGNGTTFIIRLPTLLHKTIKE